MQFTLEIGRKGLRVRREILNASGFQRAEALDIHGKEQAIVIMKKEMTAMELLNTIQSLKDLASDLLIHLAKVCGPCERCEGGCPCMEEEPRIRLPEDLLKQAGIPQNARLDAMVGDGEVILAETESFDLRDVSQEMKELFRQTNICLDELDGLLAGGSVVYAG